MRASRNLFLLVVLLGVIAVLADSLVDSLAFEHDPLWVSLFQPSIFEMYIRGSTLALFVLFGAILSWQTARREQPSR